MASTAEWTSASLATRLNGKLHGSPLIKLTKLDSLEEADEHTLSFARDARYASRWGASRAGAILIGKATVDELMGTFDVPVDRAAIVVDDADLALVSLLIDLAPDPMAPPSVVGPVYVHNAAKVDATAKLGVGVVVGENSVIGPGAVLHAGVVVGRGVTVGAKTVLHARVVIQDYCKIGAGCILQPGVVIGGDGFGYRPAPDGKGMVRIPHAGNVVVEDAVEIGANTAIDRAKFGSTRIGAMTKIDNLVQIGHNCRIGRGCIICGSCGIAGSVKIEDGVMLGGGVGIADGRTIGKGSTVGARAGVMRDVPPGETWLGTPARPVRQMMRIVSALDALPETLKKFKSITGEK